MSPKSRHCLLSISTGEYWGRGFTNPRVLSHRGRTGGEESEFLAPSEFLAQ